MRTEHEAMRVVRAELADRLDMLRSLQSRGADSAEALRSLRSLAAAYGLEPVVALADAWRRSDRPGACTSGLYLSSLRDAIGCERADAEAAQALLASVSIRLA